MTWSIGTLYSDEAGFQLHDLVNVENIALKDFPDLLRSY